MEDKWLIRQARTMSIVQQLLQGKLLQLPDGREVGISQDLMIGYVGTNVDTGEKFLAGLSEMTLRQLDRLLEEHGIGMAIPDIGR